MSIFEPKKYNILERYSVTVANALAAGIPVPPPPCVPGCSSERMQREYEAEYREAKPAMDALYKRSR